MDRPFLLSVTFLAMALSGCQKRESVQNSSTYTFTNQVGSRVTLDLYGNKADYGRDSNRIQRYVIEAGAQQAIILEVGKSYWIDWYTDSHTYNNWEAFSSGATPIAELLSVAAMNDTRPISINASDTTRSIMLNGGTSSTWKGTLTGGGSLDGTYEFVFRKDFSGHYSFTDAAGAKATVPIRYLISEVQRAVTGTSRFTVFVMDEQSRSLFTLACNLTALQHTGRNALLVQVQGHSFPHAFSVVRQ